MIQTGPKLQDKELDDSIYSWLIEQRRCEMPVSATDIINRAIFLHPDFKGGDENKRIYWVYRFRKRRVCLNVQELVSAK